MTENAAKAEQPDPYDVLYAIAEKHVPAEIIPTVRASVIGIESHAADVWLDVERRVYLGLVQRMPDARATIRAVFDEMAFEGCEPDQSIFDGWEVDAAAARRARHLSLVRGGV